MQLAEQGKIRLDEDIRAYLPGIEIVNPFDEPVTVAHLLTHTSGFEVRDPKSGDLHQDFERYVSIGEYAKANMPPVVRMPGTAYMYDNFAYLLLGLIVQNASGQPFETYMEEQVFRPLGMEASSFEPKESLLGELATGYGPAGDPMEPYALTPTIMPHGGMLSTARDVGRFMIAFLAGGTGENGRILSEASVAAMSEYRSAMHPLLPDTAYGFEAPAQTPLAGSSAAVLTKLGDLPGNSSMLLLIPDEKVGVFLTYNKNGALRDLFYGQFMAAFFPQYVAPAELAAYRPADSGSLERLVGLYADLRLAGIVYSVEADAEGGLAIRDAYLGLRKLRPADENLFADELTQRFVAFKIDEAGGAVYMNESALNPLGYARKGDAPAGFTDVGGDDPYAPYILALQSLGHYPNEEGAAFEPGRPVTRAELAELLIKVSGLRGSENAEQYAFTDIADHPLAPYIQAARELGLVVGDGSGRFHPDRAATRQEAAVMVWNVTRKQVPDALFAFVQLAGETDEWAVPAVKMMVALGLHGPEVTYGEDGAADFRSKDPITRRESAALSYKLLLQPVNQIVAELMAKLQNETEKP